jgi:hypothetical protein
VSTQRIRIEPDPGADDKGTTPKEAALLFLGVAYLAVVLVAQAGGALRASALRGFQLGVQLMPVGQIGLITVVLVGAIVALTIVAAVLRPTGVFGRVLPLLGSFLLASTIILVVAST